LNSLQNREEEDINKKKAEIEDLQLQLMFAEGARLLFFSVYKDCIGEEVYYIDQMDNPEIHAALSRSHSKEGMNEHLAKYGAQIICVEECVDECSSCYKLEIEQLDLLHDIV